VRRTRAGLRVSSSLCIFHSTEGHDILHLCSLYSKRGNRPRRVGEGPSRVRRWITHSNPVGKRGPR
jgi:hypothetical protein